MTQQAFREVGFVCRTLQGSGAGFDAGLLRELLATDADELWLLSDRLMGPVFPLTELLARADACTQDAWLLTQGSGFFALKRSALEAQAVQTWLQGQRDEEGFELALQSAQLTGQVMYDTSDWAELTTAPLLDEPVRMLSERRCPFFLHEVFHRDYGRVIDTTLGHMGQQLYAYLQAEGFDMDMLWDFLLATCHQEDLYRNLHLTYTLSTRIAPEAAVHEHLKTRRLALAMHLYYPDLLSQARAYAEAFPPETEVFVTTDTAEKQLLIEQAFEGCAVKRVEVRVIENRGRDVSALLIGLQDLAEYDYVCFFHDKKVLQTKPGTVGMGFAYQCSENLFATRAYVLNVIDLMARNKRIGLLSPPAPNHADYFFTLGMSWGPNWQPALELYGRLGLGVPISEDKTPIAPLGTCFWFRGAALARLFAYPWQYEDFPAEPNQTDGTLLHAVERIYPFVAQAEGYCPAYICTDRFAALEYTNLLHYVRGFQQVLVSNGCLNRQQTMCESARQRLWF